METYLKLTKQINTGARKFCKKLIQNALDFLYPPICLHCGEKREENRLYFCSACWKIVEVLDPKERCPHCFHLLQGKAAVCTTCIHSPRLPIPLASIFDPLSPMQKVKDIEARSSFFALQWSRLDWPDPDALIALPSEDPSQRPHLLVRHLAKLLNKPIIAPYRLHYKGPFQATFEAKGRLILHQKLLLIDEKSSLAWRLSFIESLLQERPRTLHLLSFTLS